MNWKIVSLTNMIADFLEENHKGKLIYCIKLLKYSKCL